MASGDRWEKGLWVQGDSPTHPTPLFTPLGKRNARDGHIDNGRSNWWAWIGSEDALRGPCMGPALIFRGCFFCSVKKIVCVVLTLRGVCTEVCQCHVVKFEVEHEVLASGLDFWIPIYDFVDGLRHVDMDCSWRDFWYWVVIQLVLMLECLPVFVGDSVSCFAII